MKASIITAGLAVALLAGCGGSSDDGDGTAAVPSASPSPTVACEPASPALVSRIEGLAPASSGFKVKQAAGVKSPDFANLYFVGVRFSVEGVPDETAVWAVGGGMDGTGTLVAVDNVAQEFYDGPDGDKTAAKISVVDPSVKPAKACVA